MAYAPIRVSVLRGDQKIGFDVFVEVGAKHILYLRQGDSFEGERLNRLKQKKLKKMYIREQDEPLFRDYMSRNIEMAYDSKSTQSMETRSQIIQGLQQSSAEALFEDPTSDANYALAKEGSQRFAEFLLNEDKAIKNLLAIENADQSLAHHGVTVASLAVEIAKQSGLKDVRSLSLLSLGALIHDIGHYLSNLNVGRSLAEMSGDEIKVYREHPQAGADKLKDMKSMDVQVAQIIAEHEETIDGQGFPHKLVEAKMNPLSIFVQSANHYDRLVSFEKVPPAEVTRRLISTEFLGRHPLPHLNALKTITQR